MEFMPDKVWTQYLGKTREQLTDQAESRKGELRTESYLISELFKRYLVWRELSRGISRRSQKIDEIQPTWNELKDFFSNEDVKNHPAWEYNGFELQDLVDYFLMRVRDTESFGED